MYKLEVLLGGSIRLASQNDTIAKVSLHYARFSFGTPGGDIRKVLSEIP